MVAKHFAVVRSSDDDPGSSCLLASCPEFADQQGNSIVYMFDEPKVASLGGAQRITR